MLKVGPQFVLGTKAHSPRAPLGPFHTNAMVYATEPRSGLRITWMGHATSIIEIDGIRILIDPVWDDRALSDKLEWAQAVFPAASRFERSSSH